jgi:hypothetical protein
MNRERPKPGTVHPFSILLFSCTTATRRRDVGGTRCGNVDVVKSFPDAESTEDE